MIVSVIKAWLYLYIILRSRYHSQAMIEDRPSVYLSTIHVDLFLGHPMESERGVAVNGPPVMESRKVQRKLRTYIPHDALIKHACSMQTIGIGLWLVEGTNAAQACCGGSLS